MVRVANPLLNPSTAKSAIAFEWLRQYPRYLKGIQHRLDRYQAFRDDEALSEIEPFIERWEALGEEDQARLERFRWMLEEFRISLFAQS